MEFPNYILSYVIIKYYKIMNFLANYIVFTFVVMTNI